MPGPPASAPRRSWPSGGRALARRVGCSSRVQASIRFACLAVLVGLLPFGATGWSADHTVDPAGPWEETRFRLGCDPGPSHQPEDQDPVVPPPAAPPSDMPATANVRVDLGDDGRAIVGAGFNMEQGLWSCPPFRATFRREILEPFQPAMARVDTSLLPAAPPELSADELGPAVYQSVLDSAVYEASWPFFRRLNEAGVKVVLGVWGGPAQFTQDGTRLGLLLPEYYNNYADYVVAVVDYLVRVQNIRAWAVTIGNEPDGGDGNRIPPEGFLTIARQLAPRLAAYGVKLYGPDTGSAASAMDYLPLLLSDPVVSEALAFVGFHEYAATPEVARVAEYVRARRPDLPIIVTEYTSFKFGDLDDGEEARDTLGFTLDVVNTVLSHYRSGADAALYWDAVDSLQPGHDAITKWGLLRGPGEAFERRTWYYGLQQVLPYLQPGARILASRQEGGEDLSMLGVRTEDGGLAFFLLNKGDAPLDLALDLRGGEAATLASLSVTRTDAGSEADYEGRAPLVDGSGTFSLPGRSVTTLATSRRLLPEEEEE